MRRRDFLISAAAVSVVPFLPVLAAQAAPKTYFIGQDGFYVVEADAAPVKIGFFQQDRLFFTNAEATTFRWSEIQAKDFYASA